MPLHNLLFATKFYYLIKTRRVWEFKSKINICWQENKIFVQQNHSVIVVPLYKDHFPGSNFKITEKQNIIVSDIQSYSWHLPFNLVVSDSYNGTYTQMLGSDRTHRHMNGWYKMYINLNTHCVWWAHYLPNTICHDGTKMCDTYLYQSLRQEQVKNRNLHMNGIALHLKLSKTLLMLTHNICIQAKAIFNW